MYEIFSTQNLLNLDPYRNKKAIPLDTFSSNKVMKLIKKNTNILEYKISYWLTKIFAMVMSSYFTVLTAYHLGGDNELRCQASTVGVNCQIWRKSLFPYSQPKISELDNIVRVDIKESSSNNAPFVLISNGASSLSFQVHSDEKAMEISDRLISYLRQPTEQPLIFEQDLDLNWLFFFVLLAAICSFLMPRESTIILDRNSGELVIIYRYVIARPRIQKYPIEAIVDIRIDKESGEHGSTKLVPHAYIKDGSKIRKISLTALGYDCKTHLVEPMIKDIRTFLNLET